MKPYFKAKTDDCPICPWCNTEQNIMENPSKWLPSDNEDFEDEEKICNFCKEVFFVSTDTPIHISYCSRFKKLEDWDL